MSTATKERPRTAANVPTEQPAQQPAQLPAQTERKPVNPATQFRQRAMTIAHAVLVDWVGEDRAKEATGRIAAALAASAANARDPSDFYACTPQSVATAIAVAALTGIMPGVGATALAYVVPQRPRKNEDPQLQYMLSHRGLNALARRCGQVMVAVPISTRDELRTTAAGDVEIANRDIDNPPTTLADLRGVMVLVKEIATGAVLCSGWVPTVIVEQRRKMSRSAESSYGPWSNWPVEMAMKTAMHYAISRGWCVIDDTSAARALSEEAASDLRLEGPAPKLLTGTRTDQVAELLGGPTDASPDTDAAPDLAGSLRLRITEASLEDVQALRHEINAANVSNLLEFSVVRELSTLLDTTEAALGGKPATKPVPTPTPRRGISSD